MKKVLALLDRVERDPAAAAELLEIAAGYLDEGKPLPVKLAKHLAIAFRKTASEVQPERAATLAHFLCLTNKPGRPKKPVPPLEILGALDADPQVSESSLKGQLATKHNISESTAPTRIKAMKEAKNVIGEIVEVNGGTLIPPRQQTVQKPD